VEMSGPSVGRGCRSHGKRRRPGKTQGVWRQLRGDAGKVASRHPHLSWPSVALVLKPGRVGLEVRWPQAVLQWGPSWGSHAAQETLSLQSSSFKVQSKTHCTPVGSVFQEYPGTNGHLKETFSLTSERKKQMHPHTQSRLALLFLTPPTPPSPEVPA
jgi:hypothetical protein